MRRGPRLNYSPSRLFFQEVSRGDPPATDGDGLAGEHSARDPASEGVAPDSRSAQEPVTVDEMDPALGDEGELVVFRRRGAVNARVSEVDNRLCGGGVRPEPVDLDLADGPPETVVAGAPAR